MLTKKDRRHSGRKTIYSESDEYVTQIDTYDDWNNYRDGFRNHRCKKCGKFLIKTNKCGYCYNHRYLSDYYKKARKNWMKKFRVSLLHNLNKNI